MELNKLYTFTPNLLNYLGLTLSKIYHLKRSISYSKITYVFTFLLFASPIRAQIAETFYSKKEIIEDLNYVIDRFDHLAPKPYIRSDSLSIRLKKDSIISTLSDSVSTSVARRTIAKFISSYRLGHSQMNFWALYIDSLPHFPFGVQIKNSKIFIETNSSNDASLTPGIEITSINNIGSDSLISELLSCMSLEFNETKEYYISVYFDYMLRFYYEWHDPVFTLTLKNDDGSIMKGEYKKTGINNSSSTATSGDPFFTDFKEDSIAQITIKRFSGFKRKTWHHFLKKSFQEISNRGTPYLIIDIRGNEGGNSTYLRELAAYLSKENISFEGKMIRKTTLESKRYFRNYFFKWYTYPLYPLILLNREARGVLVGKDGSIHISNEKPEKLPKVSYPYSGKVFLMTDRGTYSTASMLASCFQCYGIAKIIGIGTGEPTIGDGDAVDVILLKTGCRFSVGTTIWLNPCFEKADQNQMLIPDILCEQSKEYEFLLKYLKEKQ